MKCVNNCCDIEIQKYDENINFKFQLLRRKRVEFWYIIVKQIRYYWYNPGEISGDFLKEHWKRMKKLEIALLENLKRKLV